MKSKKATWLKKNFDAVKDHSDRSDRQKRQDRRLWKRQMSKLERKAGKKHEILQHYSRSS